MMDLWQPTSHCTWQLRRWSIVKLYCPRAGGVVFRLCYLGRSHDDYATLEQAKAAVEQESAI